MLTDRSFIYFCNAKEGAYFFDKFGRTLSVKVLNMLRANGVTGTTAQVFYEYAS